MKLTKEQFIYNLKEEALNIGLTLNIGQLEKLYEYKELLVKWNENINLTAITDDEEIIKKHIIDSLEAVKYIKPNSRVIDVGTGAGLPGIIISIYFEGNIDITLFDALNKRIIFLNEVIDKLNLKNTYAVHGRAEEKSREDEFRESYDVVISRAVATLNVLLEITIPFVKVHGTCIFMKGDKAEEELISSKSAITKLGVKIKTVDEYYLNVNKEQIKHTFIVIQKYNHTDLKYPRQFAKIKKNPL